MTTYKTISEEIKGFCSDYDIICFGIRRIADDGKFVKIFRLRMLIHN